MNTYKLLLIIGFVLFANYTIAQKPMDKFIEDDLLKAFKAIDYWADKNRTFYDANNDGKLEQANSAFAKKLVEYAKKYPSTISNPFQSLIKANLDISTSEDGLLRIYSWDTQTGGTLHYFANVFQYKNEEKIHAVLDTPGTNGDNRPNYNKLYTLKANGKRYYLAVSLSIGSSKDVGQMIQIFSLDNGKLNQEVKLIKTSSGMHGSLSIDYDFFSIVDWKVRPTIGFSTITQTITLPLVDEKGKVTHKFINYKFNGNYFEKVK